jgi:hypothetical protein
MDNIRINPGQYINTAAPKKAEDIKQPEPQVELTTAEEPVDARIQIQAPFAEKKVQEEKKSPPPVLTGENKVNEAPKGSSVPTKIFAEDSPGRPEGALSDRPQESGIGPAMDNPIAVKPYDPESGVFLEIAQPFDPVGGGWLIAADAPSFFRTGVNSIDSIAKDGLFTISGEKIA